MATKKYKYDFIVNKNETVTIRRVIDGSKTKQKKDSAQFHDVVIQYFDESEFRDLKSVEERVRKKLVQEQRPPRKGIMMLFHMIGSSRGRRRNTSKASVDKSF